jgi:hypothetical protein
LKINKDRSYPYFSLIFFVIFIYYREKPSIRWFPSSSFPCRRNAWKRLEMVTLHRLVEVLRNYAEKTPDLKELMSRAHLL